MIVLLGQVKGVDNREHQPKYLGARVSVCQPTYPSQWTLFMIQEGIPERDIGTR